MKLLKRTKDQIHNNRLLGSCSRKAGLYNVTYTHYKIHKIHNSSKNVRNVIC